MKSYTHLNFDNAPNALEQKSREIAYRAALESIVLLENNGCLPLKDKKIALYGYGAARTSKGGSGSGDVNERHSVSILEGLQNAGCEIVSKKYLDRIDALVEEGKKNLLKDTISGIAKDPGLAAFMDVVSLVQGNGIIRINEEMLEADISDDSLDTAIYVATRQAGEGADRKIEKGDNDLSPADIKNLKLLDKHFKNIVLIINVGCSLNMDFLKDVPNLGAVVFYAQQGEEGGNALADLLLGKASPSGKLTDTWAKKYEDIPFHNEFSYLNGDIKEEYYKEGILVGYRYFDSYHIEPQYPFGYGLSYTTFDLKAGAVTVDGTKVTVPVTVTNTGSYAGKEVVQVYQSAPSGVLRKEAKALVAFGKTKLLQPGESDTLELSYNLARTASYYEERAQWILDKGNYVVRIGNSSANVTPVAALQLDKLVVTEQATNICPVVMPFDELEIPFQPKEGLAGLPTLTVDANAFTTVYHTYKNPAPYHSAKVDAVMDQLSFNEKIALCVGGGMVEKERTINCYGAVGHSTLKFLDKVPNIEMCDGPAGLRIARETHVLPNGKTKATGLVSSTEFLPKFARKLVEPKPVKGERIHYQFATAWPVSIAQAQTWNTDLIHEIGTQVGEEMKAFCCTYWLAPGVNLHRNPLCGRNFEYYSEDPFLTGSFATALISGVQSIPGNYVSMKHYACNNQEDGRMGGNSNVSERALRELYLKGFGMAVMDANCTCLMSAYNKINGVATSNCYDILTKVLRNEWGFTGVVMSDWFGSLYSGKPGQGLKAGNDLQMPGIGVEPILIKLELLLGTIYKTDVERCARNVLRQILDSEVLRQLDAGELDALKD